jgi:hypothetical protein
MTFADFTYCLYRGRDMEVHAHTLNSAQSFR